MGLIVLMIRVLVTLIMILRLILWHKEASEKVYSSKFGFYIVKNMILHKDHLNGQVFVILMISVYSMVAILKNACHLKFLDGLWAFSKVQSPRSICAHFDACFQQWKILLKFCCYLFLEFDYLTECKQITAV